MLIRIESTPNPATLRFQLPRPILTGEPIAFRRSSAPRPAMAERLLNIDGVEDLLFGHDFVAVTRRASATSWADLQFEVVAELAEALAQGEDAELERWTGGAAVTEDAVVEQITELLRTRIAPQVARDGGNIRLLNYSNGIATVQMQGACGGCPSASMTLKRSVETTLKRYVPELRRVVAALEPESRKPFWRSMLEARGVKFVSD